MTSHKVEAVERWPVLRIVKDIQAFLGFANFYPRLIQEFSKVCKPLTDLTRKSNAFAWSTIYEDALQHLKQLFTEGPKLAHFDANRPTRVETDASDFGLGAVLSQLCDDGKWHPVTFHSWKFQPAEINYDVHHKEMTAIMAAFKKWEHLLRSTGDQVVVYSDHKNVEYFNSSKILNRRQHCSAEFLQPFNFKVVYREERLNEKAAVLSRRRDYRPDGGGENLENPTQTFFKPPEFQLEPERLLLQPSSLRKMTASRFSSDFALQIRIATMEDPNYQLMLADLTDPTKKESRDKSITVEDGQLFLNHWWLVPESKEIRNIILHAEHDSMVAGHFGQFKTLERVKANFYWPKIDLDVEEYVRSCDSFQ
jgi:hypothetical protein